MNDYIAYCGLDCETFEARLATINNDNELRIKVSKEWSGQLSITILMHGEGFWGEYEKRTERLKYCLFVFYWR